MRRLIEHILGLPDDAVGSIPIQDIAIGHLWLHNGGPEIDDIAGHEALRPRVQHWLAVARPEPPSSEGRRCQTLLRELIDRVEAGEVDELARDELDLLETVYSFAHSCQHSDAFERVRRAIAPRRARIAARRAGLESAQGVPTLAKRLLVVLPDDILKSPQRDVRVLAGVELPARGPVLVHAGHVRVLGDVPEGATLVVEEAACVVDGYVLGRIAVSGNAEILENVSGVVISRNGDVRARNIVDSAFVVAKRGRVACRRVHGARLVFAGDSLAVVEVAARSHLLAPIVEAREAVESGRIDMSERAKAGRFGGGGPLDVLMRRGLSCRDYGENPGRSMSADVSRALHARAGLQYAQAQVSLALRGAEQSAETCLMYLLASEESSQIAAEVVTAQRRLDVLNRIVMGLRAVYAHAEARSGDGVEDGEDKPAPRLDLLERIDADIAAMIGEMPDDETLRASYNELNDARGNLSQRGDSQSMLESTLEQTAEKLERWRKEADGLRAIIERGHSVLGKTRRVRELLGNEGLSRSKILTLQRIMGRARTESHDSSLRIRSESPFVTLMMRSIEKRLTEAKKVNADLDALRREFESARHHVWNHYQMRIDNDTGIEHRISVEGRFEHGVRLFADPRYFCEVTAEGPAQSEFSPPPSQGEIVRYVCAGGRTRHEPIESASTAATAPEPALA